MESQWTEVHRTCDNDPNKISPISSLVWDPYQDLLWAGNDKGRVSSYYAPEGLQRYTSFKGHADQQIRQIALNERGIVSLSSNSLQMRNRRGIVKWNISNDDTRDLHCMTTSTLGNNELLVAGQQDELLVVNVNYGSISRKIAGAANTVVMKKAASSRLICCGSMAGEVTLRDPRTMNVEQRVQAHTGTLSDLEVSGNMMLTCGFSNRQGSLMVDPLVKVYDIRMAIRSLAPIPFPSGPVFLKMHPRLSTTVFIVSQSGQFQVCDVTNVAMGLHTPAGQFYQIPTSSYITSIDVSSSGETVAIGDASSFIFQYADRQDYSINAYSDPLDAPDQPHPRPNIIMDDSSPLSLVGMPHYTEPLLSSWPANMTFEVGLPPPQIEEEVLRNMKTIDFVGYAPNPGTRRRNQVVRRNNHKNVNAPKFRSQQALELLRGGGGAIDEGEDSADGGDVPKRKLSVDPTGLKMPSAYGRVEIQYSKFGVEDFDFGFYNHTKYGGLETHIANSYCNSMLQMLHFTLPLRKIAISHIGMDCQKENCLCCELGFLFRMLEDANGQNCQATNFLRAFSTIPQAGALGLFEPEQPDNTISYSMLIQNFIRFILEQLHQETYVPTANPILLPSIAANTEQEAAADLPSTIQQVFGLKTTNYSKCSHCSNEIIRTTYPYVVDIMYPKKLASSNVKQDQRIKKRSFASLLKTSINRETKTKAYCVNCQQYQPIATKKLLRDLPSILTINSGITSSEQASLWRHHANGNGKAGQTSVHNSANSPRTDSDSGAESPGAASKTWLPERLLIRIVGDEIEIKALDPRLPVPTEFLVGSQKLAVYELSSIVSQVQNDRAVPHLVSQIRVPGSELEPQAKSPWYLFNDFLVKNIEAEEVFSFKGSWKIPSILQYTRLDLDQLLDLSKLPSQVDLSILFKNISLTNNASEEQRSYKVLSEDEMPKPGTLVSIDAEFVALSQEETEIRSDGTKSLIRPSRLSLARVSVLRGESGDMEGIPFIDDYIANSEPIVDYLTEYSGIEAGDLDPQTSKHTLVPLKMAYKKLRLLVDLGCIFIGHGLKSDFRIINILVPPDQVIDTLDIYYMRNRQRKISLRFLAWALLQLDIQQVTHNSIEDAKTALLLYKKYLELREKGTFGSVLEDIYEMGRKSNWLKSAPKDSNGINSPAIFKR
ncbi:poly(A)-specific ribonuclease [Umbelopsis nana]